MSARRLAAAFVLVALTVAGCAPVPTPRVVEQADRISQSPAAREARELAQPSWARAEKSRLEAHEALEEGPAARAQFLGEEAIALYNEGAALSRLAKATLREKTHDVDREALEKELAELDAKQSVAGTDVAALEARLRALRTLGGGAGQGARADAARREATKTFIVQARLLCGAARALSHGGPTAPSPTGADDPTSPANVAKDLSTAETQLAAIEAELADPKKAAPIEAAASARASCSAILARSRRSLPKSASTGPGSPDELLQALSAMVASRKSESLDPERDERGVVVVMREVFDGEALSKSARERLGDLERVAATHPRFPIAVVLHSDKPLSKAERSKWEARGVALLAAMKGVDDARKRVILAEDAVPVVARSSSERASNARVEIVFIAPEAL